MDNLEFDRLLHFATQLADRASDHSLDMEYRQCYFQCLSSIYSTLQQLASDFM